MIFFREIVSPISSMTTYLLMFAPSLFFYISKEKKIFVKFFFKLRFDEFFYKYLSLMHDINPYTLKIDNF